MRLEWLGFAAVVLAAVLEPDLKHRKVRVKESRFSNSCETYLDLFLAERDAADNTRSGNLVRFRVSLVFGFENRVILWAIQTDTVTPVSQDASGGARMPKNGQHT
jgi:hypothetical protein